MDNSRSCVSFLSRFFEYDTPKMLHTTSKLVGVLHRLLQLFIFVFMFAYFIGYKRGYQDVSEAIVSVNRVAGRPSEQGVPNWNSPIFLTVGQDDMALIPTYSTTLLQVKNICIEDREVEGALCNPYNNRCVANRSLAGGNGNMTGRCISSQGTPITQPVDDDVYFACEINGWCLMNREIVDVAEDWNLKEMILVIQSDVNFPRFPNQGHLSNYDKNMELCLRHHRFHSADDPWCPLFRIGDILDRDNSVVDGKRIDNYKETTRKGATFLIHVVWDCNFDVEDPAKQCSVDYRIRRMDTPIKDFDAHSNELRYVKTVGDVARFVVYLEGIRFIVRVQGTARKFNIFTLLLRVGASFGLFAIAAVLCEVLILFSCCPRERQVRNFKFVHMKSQLVPNKAKDIYEA